MTNDDAQIVPAGGHVYEMRLTLDGEAVLVTLRADPETVSRIGVESADELRLVEETAAYLIRRQRPDDLPPALDLADVAAAYPNWFDDMRAGLRGAAGGTSAE